MKKLIFILMFLLVFSSIALSACAKTPSTNSKSQSSSESTSSHEGKASRTNAIPSISISIPENSQPNSNSGSITPSGNAYYVSKAIVDSSDTSPVANAIRAINRIDSVSAFDYETKEQLIQSAEQKCSLVADKSQITNYDSLLQARSKFNTFKATGEVNAFMTKYNALPDATAVGQSNVITVCELRSTYASFSQEALALLTDKESISQKLTACFDKLLADGLLENKLVLDNLTNLSDSTFFKFSQGLTLDTQSNDKLTYGGVALSKCVVLSFGAETISFNTYITGNLTIYCYRTDALTITSDDGTLVQTSIDTSMGDDYCVRTYAITSTGNYVISAPDGSEVNIFALEVKAV